MNRILIYIIIVCFIAGCGKPYKASMRIPKLSKAKELLMRKKKIEEIEKVQLAQFDKDIKVLEIRNPFSPTATGAGATQAISLSGIIWDEENPAAMIGDRIVKEGDMVGKKKVKKIQEDKVILIEAGKEHILELEF